VHDLSEESYNIQEYLQDYTESSPDKEIRIINAAINIFSEKGFEATRTREIADRAGIAEGTIFRYFPTKDAILERMVPLLIRVMLPRFTGPIERIIKNHATDSVENILFEIIIDRLHMIRDNGKFIKSVVPELIHRAPLLKQMETNVLPVIDQFVGKVVAYGKARGELDPDLDSHLVMMELVGFIFSNAMFGTEDSKQQEHDIRTFLQYTMKGWNSSCKP
jgi:AcrR family transcriptional regulator